MSKEHSRIIVVIATKGGVGKSSLFNKNNKEAIASKNYKDKFFDKLKGRMNNAKKS